MDLLHDMYYWNDERWLSYLKDCQKNRHRNTDIPATEPQKYTLIEKHFVPSFVVESLTKSEAHELIVLKNDEVATYYLLIERREQTQKLLEEQHELRETMKFYSNSDVSYGQLLKKDN